MAEPSTRKFKTICVFSSLHFGKNKEHWKAANELGKTLAARKIDLVFGGGSLGLRGCVSSSAYIGGCKVLGIMLKALAEHKHITGGTIGNELQVMSMHERIAYMQHNADAFIALPGGLETFEDIFNIASWAQLNLHQKPLGLLNVDGFYDSLLSFLDHAVEQGLMTQASRRILVSASTANELIDQLQNFVPEPDPLMKQVVWHPKDSSSKKRVLDLNLRL